MLSPGAGGGAPTPRWRSSARRSSGAFDAVPEGGEASSARVSVVRPSPYAEVLRAARASTCEDPTSPRGGTARLAPPSPAPQRALSPEPQGAAADAQGDEEEEDDYAQDLERLVDAAADDEDSALAAGALESLQGILDYTLRCVAGRIMRQCVCRGYLRRAGACARRCVSGAASDLYCRESCSSADGAICGAQARRRHGQRGGGPRGVGAPRHDGLLDGAAACAASARSAVCRLRCTARADD